jgi:hypothetical protein
MSIIIILVVIAACVAQQLIFSSLVRSFAILMSAILGAFLAINFHEALADIMIGSDIMAWKAHGIAMLLIFLLAFAILAAISIKLLSGEIAFGGLIDKIGGSVIALFTGYVISGVLISSLSLLSGSNSFPYERFSSGRPDMQKPSGALLSPDGFIAGFFGFVSDGSLAGSNSFAALRAGFNDSAAIDRLAAEKKLSPLGGKNVIQGTPVIWPAPANTTDAAGKALPESSGGELVFVRLTMTRAAIGKDSPNFLLGQLRMICRSKDSKGPANEGSGVAVYPIGYMKTPTGLTLESANAIVSLADAASSGTKAIDFAFYVPAGTRPSLIEIKRNIVVQAPSISDAKDVSAPEGLEQPKAPAPVTEANAPR